MMLPITFSSSMIACISFKSTWFSLSSMAFKILISWMMAEKLPLKEFCADQMRELKIPACSCTVFWILSNTWEASW